MVGLSIHLDYENRNRSSNTLSSNYKYLKEDKLAVVNSLYVEDITRIMKHSIKINLHAIPWRSNDYDGAIINIIGQNLADLAQYVDIISPMCYHHMVKHETAWIHDVTNNIHE